MPTDSTRRSSKLTLSEEAELSLITDRYKTPGDSGLASDNPLTATQLTSMTGSKSRNAYQSLVRKGYLHSYGKGKGAVPTVIHEPPPEGKVEWFGLSDQQRAILKCFDGGTWCCRPPSFLDWWKAMVKQGRVPLRKGTVGLMGTQIADKVGKEYDHHFRAALRNLVEMGVLVKGRSPTATRTHVGYLPSPDGWPFRALSIAHCPAIDAVNWHRRKRNLSALPQL